MTNHSKFNISLKHFVLYILFFVVVLFFSVSIDHKPLHVLHGEAIYVEEIGKIYIPGWDSFRFNPLHRGLISASYVLITFLYYSFTMILGLSFLSPLRRQGFSYFAWIGASFIAGYVLIVPINRIITLFAPHSIAPQIIFSSLCLISIVCFFLNRVSDLLRCTTLPYLNQDDGERPVQYLIVKSFLGVLVFFLFFIILELQFGRNFMIADSGTVIMRFLENTFSRFDASNFLPLSNEQYDELLYNYPLVFIEPGKRVFMFPFWLTNALGKAAAFMFIYGIMRFRSFKVSRKIAVLVPMFLFFGTQSWNPFYYITLFGGQNPLAYNGHIGRMLGVILCLLLFSMMIVNQRHFKDLNEDIQIKNRSFLQNSTLLNKVLFPFLFGLGIVGTSFHNLYYSLVILGLFFVFVILQNKCGAFVSSFKSWYVMVALLSVGHILNYALLRSSYNNGAILFLSIGLSFLFFIQLILFTKNNQNVELNVNSATTGHSSYNVPVFKLESFVVSFVCGLIFSSLFLGNLFITKTVQSFSKMNVLSYLPVSFSLPMISRGAANIYNGLKLFSWNGCATPSYHCQSLKMYLAYYGLWTLLGLFGGIFLVQQFEKTQNKIYHTGLIFYSCIWIAFDSAMFLTDYVNSSTMVWIVTRFIEVPYYAMYLLFGFVLSKIRIKTHRVILVTVFGFWAIFPFVINGGLGHWIRNLKYLIHG